MIYRLVHETNSRLPSTVCVDPDMSPMVQCSTFLALIAVQGKGVVLPTHPSPKRCGFKEGRVSLAMHMHPDYRGRGAPAPKAPAPPYAPADKHTVYSLAHA